MAVLVVTRDPDFANDYRVFGEPEPTIIDIDLGADDLRDPEEFAEWAAGLQQQANELGRDDPDKVAAALFIQQTITEAERNFGHRED